MTDEELLAELEDLLRTMPPMNKLGNDSPDVLSWLGRAAAIISNWRPEMMISVQLHLDKLHSGMARDYDKACRGLIVILHQARAALRMKTLGPSNVAVASSMVFDYFDEIRKVIEVAKSDILFVDPYLDSDFVSRYLPHVTPGVRIRLLAREKIQTLLPAAKLFVAQNKAKLEIRSAHDFHDRYVFIDESDCYQSGASFKDGAKNAPTTITQITDAFAAVFQTYQEIWRDAEVVL
ncbi:MAG: hypothetical protein ACE5OQ_12645 [Woeseia sp.]